MKTRKTSCAAAFAALVVTSVLACGPGTEITDNVCCTEFKVGATLDAKIASSAQGQVAAQAVADVAGIASAAVDDLTTACRSIAQDLDAPKDKADAAEKETDRRARLQAWCKLAVDAIGSVKASAGGTLAIEFAPPKCEASISAKANCQAKCSASGSCDIKAHPPTCTGGSLQIACKGECKAKAGAKLTCEGKCTGECKGSCTASGGVAVQCNGKCEGTCSADAQGNGSGVNAQGECAGFCKGTCTMKADAPAVSCDGSCNGECSASCTGTAQASVKCDGDCAVDYEPLSCQGGKLEGGCQVDAKCDGNCDASVKAKAQCTPPSVTIAFSGAADVQAAGKLQATLEANLPVVFAFGARLDGLKELAVQMSGNISAFADIKVACLPAIAASAASAGEDAGASFQATLDIGRAVGAN